MFRRIQTNIPILVLSGPTGVGKTRIALAAAKENPQIEIINADSVSFYKEFNIGSAKPSLEERSMVPHHLIDIANPDEDYNVAKFLPDVQNALEAIHNRNHRALVIGGSGFYLKSLLYGLWPAPGKDDEFRKNCDSQSLETLYEKLKIIDPESSRKVSPNDRYRMTRALEVFHLTQKTPTELENQMPKQAAPNVHFWCMDSELDPLENRLRSRVLEMLDQGWIDETKSLKLKHPNARALDSVGYREILAFLNGAKPKGRKPKPGIEGLANEIVLAHRQLAKGQRTWMKGLEPEKTFVIPENEAILLGEIKKFYL